MDAYKQAIQGLIAANQQIQPRTPFLEVSLGGLRTALEQAGYHEAELAKLALKVPVPEQPAGAEPQPAAQS